MKHYVAMAAFGAAMTVSGLAFAQDFTVSGDMNTVTATDGKGIYNAVCAGCHMPDGAGAVGAGYYPALAGNENLEAPDYAIYLILHGQKAMPDLGGIMSDAQVAEVVNYIRHNLGNNYEGEVDAEYVAQSR